MVHFNEAKLYAISSSTKYNKELSPLRGKTGYGNNTRLPTNKHESTWYMKQQLVHVIPSLCSSARFIMADIVILIDVNFDAVISVVIILPVDAY